MSRIKRVNVRYGQIVFDLDDIDRIMEECWKIVRAAKKAELIYEKDKEAAEKQFRTEAAKHFEKAFGKGSCWKVFGTHYPSSTGYAEFINQITALIKKWNVVDQGNEILKDFHGYRYLDWSALSKAASTLVLNFLDTLIEFIHNIDWSKIVTNIQDALTNIQWIAIAEKILELLGYALGSITGALARLIGNLIAQGASEAYQYFEDKIKEAGGNVVDGILLGILDALLGIGSWIVDNVFKPILDGFKNAFGIHSPSTVMQEQGHYIIEGLLLGITDFLSKIKKKFEEIRNLVTEKMDNIKSSAVSKVNEMKKGLSDGVERIKESFRSGFSTLVGYVKSPINSIIRFINNFLYAIQTMQNSFANALNSMSISLPHWLEKLTGFSSVGFNVGYWSAPMVPYLAQGAVIPPNKEFMAVLGDQKSGNNIEAPESLIRRIVREESGNGKGSTYNVTAQVNRRTLFDLVLEEGKVRRTVTGRNPFETV